MQISSNEKLLRLTVEQESFLRKAVKGSLINFCEATDENYISSWFHEHLASILQNAYEQVKQGKEVRIILEVPPRHGKSELATIKLPAWVLGQSPEFPIIVSSYSADLATDFGQKTRDLMNSNNYQRFFKTKLREDSQSKGKWMTDKNGGYTATGVGGAITGKGGKILLVDDPFKNREEADSDNNRNKVWNWWTSTFYTRQEGVTAIIVIMTRWHLDDLVGRLVEQQSKLEEAGETNIDRWNIIRFPAIAEEDELNRLKGEALWPEKFSIEKLRTIENSIGVSDFEALYQQNPLAGSTATFKQEYFSYFKEEELPPKMTIDITVDPAISKKKSACNTAIVGVGKAYLNPNWYLLDYKFGKFNPGELIENTFSLYESFRSLYPDADIRVWVEGVAYQESLSYFFKEEMKRRQIYFILNTFIDRHDKEQRIKGLEPMYRVGIIKHRAWMKDLESELVKFPVGKTVDIIDALSFHTVIKMNTGQTPETKIKTMLERMEERQGRQNKGFVENTFLL